MQPQQTGDSGGKGLVIFIGIALMIAGAIYFAYVKKVNFPGSSIVRNITGAAVVEPQPPKPQPNSKNNAYGQSSP